jgi:hypothetical protein
MRYFKHANVIYEQPLNSSFCHIIMCSVGFSNLTTIFIFDLGASSFTSLTAMSLLDFTNKLLGVIKFAAEMAFDIMSPEATVVQGKLPHPNISR